MQNVKSFVQAANAALGDLLPTLPEADRNGLEQAFANGSRLVLAVELDADASVCVSLGLVNQSGERKTVLIANGKEMQRQ